MATLAELITLQGNTELKNRITSAIAIALANAKETGSLTQTQQDNLLDLISDPQGSAASIMWGVLAQNESTDIAVIPNATDAGIVRRR